MSLIQMLLKHEGLVLKPYRDTVGKLTIGIGRNLDDNGISKDEALFLLQNDVQRVREELTRTFPWYSQLDGVRADVIANMCFNVGLPSLLKFKQMLAAVERKDYPKAAFEMLNSKWANQVGQRAIQLARMMRTGKEEDNGN